MTGSPVVLNATVKHTASIIFLHGLGDTGHGWSSALSAVRLPHIKVICPTANTIPVSLNNGFKMPAWFDIKGLDISAAEDVDGIKKATTYVHTLIEKEISEGIPSERIMIGGFSQGGALAIHSALTFPKKLAGIIALSCWLPMSKSFNPSMEELGETVQELNRIGGKAGFTINFGKSKILATTPDSPKIDPLTHDITNRVTIHSMVPVNKDVHIIQCHGDCDPIVSYNFGQLTASVLKNVTKNLIFKTYNGMMHSSSDEEMIDIKNFIKSLLPAV